MSRLKNLMLNLVFAGVIAMPAALLGQDNSQSTGTDSLGNNSSQQSTQTNSMSNTSNDRQSMDNSSVTITSDQLDQAFARLNENPDDNVKTELENVAETHAKDLQTKLGLNDDAYNDVKDAINNYLDKGWEKRVELAKKAGDPDAYKDKSADLAELRVDLAKDIKSDIGKENISKWNSNAVNFWTSLDEADFHVKAKEAGIAAGSLGETPGMDKNQMNMNNDQQNQNQNNTTDQNNNQNSTDQNNKNQNNSDQNSTDQTTPDQGQGTNDQNVK